jgi:hypothetical protein
LALRKCLLTVGLVLGSVSIACGQAPGATAHGSVQLTVPPVMELVVARSGKVAPRASGDYATAAAATRVRVSANFSWKLVAVRRTAVQVPASSEAMASNAVQPVWVRAAAPDDRVRPLAEQFVDTSGGRVVVAEGEAGGDMEVVVDYRWLRGRGAGGDFVEDVSFVLIPR